MGARQHKMAAFVDQAAPRLRWIAPQDEGERTRSLAQRANHRIRQRLPAQLEMRSRPRPPPPP